MMLKAVVLVLSVLVSGSSQQCFSSNDTAPTLATGRSATLAEFRLKFTLKLFQILNKYDNLGNVIFSPSSIYDLLQLAYFGAAGETEASLTNVFANEHWNKSHIYRFFRDKTLITSDPEFITYPLKTANKLFFSNKLNLRPCVVENLKNNIELIDYQTDVERARTYINKWIEDVTQGEIKDFLTTLSPTTTVTLVNAVYFKAKWEIKFDPKYTKRLPFHVNSKITKMTSMIKKTDHFDIADYHEIDSRVLRLFYQGGRQAMFIILPNNDLHKMIQGLYYSLVEHIINGRRSKKLFMKVMIPKFKDSNEIQLNHALNELGIGNALSPDADYSRFTGRKEVSFDTLIQKAMIEVDEEGTKAAAVTGNVSKSRPILSESFICDRPFTYFIYDYFTDTVLFMGTFRHPK